MDIIDKIINLETHLSQKEVAKRLGVTPATVRNWKKTGRVPKQKQQEKINRVYGANKRYMSDDTIKQAQHKINERNYKNMFTIRTISGRDYAARFLNEPEERSCKLQFLHEGYGHATGFYSFDQSKCQWAQAEMPPKIGLPKGQVFLRLLCIMKMDIDTDRDKDIRYFHTFGIVLNIKNDMELEQAINMLAAKAMVLTVKKGKRRDYVNSFLGYEITRIR